MDFKFNAPETPIRKRSPEKESQEGIEHFDKRSQDLRTDEEKAYEKRSPTPPIIIPENDPDDISIDSISDIKPEPDSGRLTIEDLSTNSISGTVIFFVTLTMEKFICLFGSGPYSTFTYKNI